MPPHVNLHHRSWNSICPVLYVHLHHQVDGILPNYNCPADRHVGGSHALSNYFANQAICSRIVKDEHTIVHHNNGSVHYTLWSSSSKFKKGKYALVLDGNGRLGIYGQRRWTSSNQKELGLLDGSTVTTEYVLFSGDRLMPPRKLEYKNYGVEFMRCNLVIKDDQSGRILWQTSTDARSCYARLETDGELTVKHKGERLWGSNSKGSNGPYIAVLRFDGRLNVFGPLRWTHDGRHDSLSSNISFPSKI